MEQETYVFKNEDYESHLDIIKKYLRPALLWLASLLFLLITLLIFARCEKPVPEGEINKPSFALYMKSGELNFTDTHTQKRLSSNLKTMSNQENYSFSPDKIKGIGDFVCVTYDGKRVFFGDKNADGGMSLYVTDVNTTDEPQLILKNVKEYSVSEDGERVAILDNDGGFFLYDFKESKKISDNIKSYLPSSDHKKVYLRDGNGNLYVYRQGGKLTLMTETLVSSLLGADGDFSTVYYTDSNGDVIKQKQGGLPVTLIDGESSALSITSMLSFKDGTAYFICNRSSADNGIWYMEKDGSVKKFPLKNAGAITCIALAKDTSVALFEVKNRVDDGVKSYFLGANGSLTKIYEDGFAGNHVKAMIKNDGRELYFLDSYQSQAFFVDVEKGSDSPKKIANAIDGELHGFYGEKYFALCFWQTEGGISRQGITLFESGEEAARLQDTFKTEYCERTDTFYFLSGYSDKTAKGTLMSYKDGKLSELESGVCDFTVTENGDLLLIKDYSPSEKKGTLYLYSEDGNIFIDREVSAFVETSEGVKKHWEQEKNYESK